MVPFIFRHIGRKCGELALSKAVLNIIYIESVRASEHCNPGGINFAAGRNLLLIDQREKLPMANAKLCYQYYPASFALYPLPQ